MKKYISLILLGCMALTIFTGCSGKNNINTSATPTQEADANITQTPTVESTEVRVTALKGPTAMGMVKFMDDADQSRLTDNTYKFSITAAIDEVTPLLVKGETDIAAVPANLASVLYNNTQGKVQVLAINTLGVLYLVENGETIQSVNDLKGKTIYASGKGATPEYALNYILSSNGIDPQKDVTIEWKSEHAECVAALSSEEGAIALLPQPFVTTAQAKVNTIRIALDLTEEWNKLQTDSEHPSALLTGVVVARTDFVKEHPEAVAAFLQHYEESVTYVNDNVADAAALVETYDIVPAKVAEKAIPFCNITCITGDEMKTKLSGYLSVLMDQNPKAIGGSLPADDFYYIP